MRRDFLEARYEILETLEDDGQQAAFKVKHRLLGEICALRLRPHRLDEPTLRAAFDQRLPWFTRLKHPRISTVFDVSIEGASAVMESAWQEGAPLPDWIATSADVESARHLRWQLAVAEQMIDAVAYLHSAQWAHGSLQPGKFILGRHQASGGGTASQPDEPRLSLIDPGFARLVGAPEKTTAGGLLMKRLRHSPPERFVGEEEEPTVAGDIYTLGLILYEWLTGHYPISGDQPTSIAAGHLLRPPLDFEVSDPEGRLPDPIRHALLCCLAKAPEARYTELDELRQALAEGRASLADDAPASGPETPAQRSRQTRPAAAEAEPAEAEPAERAGRSELRRLLEQARRAAERRDYTAARRSLRRGQELAPEDPRLAGLLRDVERAAREQQQQERRRRQLDEAAAEVEQLLALGDWRRARGRLETAGRQVGSSDRLRALEKRLEDFERRHRQASEAKPRADDLVEKARRLSQAESFESALDTLGEALEMEPDHAAARTLSESVAALAAMHRREGDRQATIESTTRVIQEHLEKGEPGRAMAQLNRAVARYGNRTDLQELRFAIADAFLREQVGDAAPPAPASPASPPAAHLPPPPPAAPPPAGSSPAPPAVSSPASSPPTTGPGSSPAEGGEQLSEGVDGFELAGLGASGEPSPSEPETPTTPTVLSQPPSAWLDLRRPQAWLLILALMATVALFGHWLAQRQNVDAPPPETQQIEAEDVRPTTPQ